MTRKMLTLRLPDDLTETLKQEAEASSISVTEFVTRLLRQSLNKEHVSKLESLEQLSFEKIGSLESRVDVLESDKLQIKDKIDKVEEEFREFRGRVLGHLESLENLFIKAQRPL